MTRPRQRSRWLGTAASWAALIAVPVVVVAGVREALGSDLRLGALLAPTGVVALWGAGGAMLRQRGYEPGRHYMLGGVLAFGTLGGLSLYRALTTDSVVSSALSSLVSLILIPLALLALYVWLRPPGSPHH